MSRKTVLEIVQDILNDMESDEVNSINDTVEAQQVASILRNTYDEIINSRLWPTNASIIQLTALSKSSKPTHFKLDDDISNIDWIKYDKRKIITDAYAYDTVTYKEPSEFLQIILTRTSTDANIQLVIEDTGIPLPIRTDLAPTYWTSFDDEYIVMDSFDSNIDSTLQAAKSMASVYREPTFSMIDTFIPDLPAKAFPYLIAETKSSCFEKIKQAPSAKEEQKSRRQRIFLGQEKWRKNRGVKYTGFGRK